MLLPLGTQPIETCRLRLRPFTLLDFYDVYHNWTSRPEVARYMRWTPHQSPTETGRLLRIWTKDYQDSLCFHWAISLKESKQPIGSIRLFITEYEDDRGEVGYSLSPDYWGRGIMSEALEAVLAYGFERVGFHRIEGFCATENPASGRVMEKVGMKKEGTFPQRSRLHTGEFVDCDGYAMLQGEYLEKHPLW